MYIVENPEFKDGLDGSRYGERMGKEISKKIPAAWFRYNGSRIAIVGRPQSGKSHLVSSLITGTKPKIYRQRFHKIYILIPEESYNSLDPNPYEELADRGQVFHSLDDLAEIYELLKENARRSRTSLLFIDDFGSDLHSGTALVWLTKMLTKSRHLRTMMMLALQSPLQMIKEHRRMLNGIVLFEPSRDDYYAIMNEKMGRHRPEYWDEIHRLAYDRPHSYLTINLEDGGAPRLYVRSHRLMLEDEPDTLEENKTES
jgi:hypothetical protein